MYGRRKRVRWWSVTQWSRVNHRQRVELSFQLSPSTMSWSRIFTLHTTALPGTHSDLAPWLSPWKRQVWKKRYLVMVEEWLCLNGCIIKRKKKCITFSTYTRPEVYRHNFFLWKHFIKHIFPITQPTTFHYKQNVFSVKLLISPSYWNFQHHAYAVSIRRWLHVV